MNTKITAETWEPKQLSYQGPGWYCPSERRWIAYHEYKHLPTEAKRDAIEFIREEDFLTYLRKRDLPHAPNIAAYIPIGVPEVKWEGHDRVAAVDLLVSENYTNYEEILKNHNDGQFVAPSGIPRLPQSSLVYKVSGIL